MPEIWKLFRRVDGATRGRRATGRISILDRVFLHVGLEKTGTTTLQVTMALNRRLLERYGYFFPTTLEGSPSNHIGLALCAANPEAATDLRQYAGLTSGAAYAAFLQRYPRQIAEALTQSGCHSAILSNEHCSSRLFTIAEIAKLRDIITPLARECRAIIYLRRQDELVASHYSNSVKAGATHEFYYPNGIQWLDYLRVLDMWAQVFGKENLTIRIFEPEQLRDGDLVADFFSTIGFAHYSQLVRPENQNRSLDIHTVEFLRRLNAHLPTCSDIGISRDRGSINEALAAITTRERLRPSAEAATTFLDQFAVSNAEVARRFLNRENGVLFTSTPLCNEPRLPSLDVDQAVAISAALWQWQAARLRAPKHADTTGLRREARPMLDPKFYRNKRGRF
jgi:hypothetical protein